MVFLCELQNPVLTEMMGGSGWVLVVEIKAGIAVDEVGNLGQGWQAQCFPQSIPKRRFGAFHDRNFKPFLQILIALPHNLDT